MNSQINPRGLLQKTCQSAVPILDQERALLSNQQTGYKPSYGFPQSVSDLDLGRGELAFEVITGGNFSRSSSFIPYARTCLNGVPMESVIADEMEEMAKLRSMIRVIGVTLYNVAMNRDVPNQTDGFSVSVGGIVPCLNTGPYAIFPSSLILARLPKKERAPMVSEYNESSQSESRRILETVSLDHYVEEPFLSRAEKKRMIKSKIFMDMIKPIVASSIRYMFELGHLYETSPAATPALKMDDALKNIEAEVLKPGKAFNNAYDGNKSPVVIFGDKKYEEEAVQHFMNLMVLPGGALHTQGGECVDKSMQVGAILLSLVGSSIVGISQNGSAEGEYFDLLQCPMMISMMNRFYA